MIDNTTCGADSFMMRDGVCDERANIARCLFDGGDCCLENKIKANCDYCPCMLDIDQKNLENQFRELNIKPVKDHESLESFIESWTVEVEHVVAEEVCAVFCLDHHKADELNAWDYDSEGICRCGWVESKSCPEKLLVADWTLDKDMAMFMSRGTTFVQLYKTVSCGNLLCLIVVIVRLSF